MTSPVIRPALEKEEVSLVISALEADDTSLLIGGQATVLWAWFFGERYPQLAAIGPATSQDIDYFGTVAAAKSLAAALDGTVSIPDADDYTPNTAHVVATINGKTVEIDFMHSVLGILTRELNTGVSEIAVPGVVDGKETNITIRVMHPLLCFKSRVINMLHPATARTDLIAQKQLEVSAAVLGVYIDDALASNDWNEAKDCFRTLYAYLRSNEYVKKSHSSLSLDALDIIKQFRTDTRIDERYRAMQMAQMVANIERRRSGWGTQSDLLSEKVEGGT